MDNLEWHVDSSKRTGKMVNSANWLTLSVSTARDGV
jgi:hypothetical protein